MARRRSKKKPLVQQVQEKVLKQKYLDPEGADVDPEEIELVKKLKAPGGTYQDALREERVKMLRNITKKRRNKRS